MGNNFVEQWFLYRLGAYYYTTTPYLPSVVFLEVGIGYFYRAKCTIAILFFLPQYFGRDTTYIPSRPCRYLSCDTCYISV